MKKIRKSKIIIPIIFMILSLLMLTPFLVMVSTSFKTAEEIRMFPTNLIPKNFTIMNYVESMKRGIWLRWILNSVFVTTTVTVVSLIFNSSAGYAYSRLEFKGRNFMFITTLFGLMIPPQIIMIPVFIILKSIPFAGGNNIFGQGGTGFIDTYAALMLPHLAGAFGVFLCRQFYLSFPKELDEAATIDGCSKLGIYFRMYIPLSQPLLATLGVLKITNTWNDFLWPLILTNSVKLRTVQLAISIFRNEVVEWNLLMAATTVITLPLIVLFLFAQKFFIQGISTSGIKG